MQKLFNFFCMADMSAFAFYVLCRPFYVRFQPVHFSHPCRFGSETKRVIVLRQHAGRRCPL